MNLLLPFLLQATLAAPPANLNVHLKGDLDINAADAYRSFGWGLRGGVQMVPRLWFEGGFDLSFMPGGRFRTALYPSLRLFLTKPDANWGGVSLRVGGGVDLEFPQRQPTVVQPVLLPALGLDLRLFDDLRMRFDAGYVTHFDDVGALQGQLGVVFRPRRKVPEVVELPPEPFEESGLVWLGAPVCDWSDPEEARAFIAESEGDPLEETNVPAPVTEGTDLLAGEGSDTTPEPPEEQSVPVGSLVVVGWAGDVGAVTVTSFDDDEPIEAPIERFADDGVVVLTVPEGVVDVSVVGGGRSANLDSPVAISEGNATWVRFADPPDARILFDMGSSVISEEGKALIGSMASQSGNAYWSLLGSYSPEGSVESNIRLGTSRAEAVRELLVAGGVDASRVSISTREFPNPDEPPEQQRSVEIVPLTKAPEAP